MRRNGFTLIELLVVLAIVGGVAWVLFPVFDRAKDNARRAGCQSNLKSISLALKMYSQDANGQFPAVELRGRFFGWADALRSYGKYDGVFRCPQKTGTATKGARLAGYTDYYFNERLSSQKLTMLATPASVATFGDGNDGIDLNNARYALRQPRNRWILDQKSPAQRHLGGANYAFADGHVKWLQPDKITSDAPKNGVYTFALR